jgi:octanoyl-[GcvH]:protein N-octanoyltransferase
LRVARERSPRAPALEAAVSHALLLGVAAGRLGPTLRVYRPAPTLAFGKLDALRPGYARAAAVAWERGFTPVLRAPGGHAAAYDEGTVGFDLVLPTETLFAGLQEVFGATSDALARELGALGVDARVGEVPGEYCRGDYTVNAGGRTKLAGTAQRAIRGASLLGGFVTVRGSARLRDVLVPVYEALDLDWDPATLGAVEDEAAGVGLDDVQRAVVAALAPGDAAEAPIDDETLDAARRLEARHAIAP